MSASGLQASEGAVLEDSPLKRKREELQILDVCMEKYEAVCVNTTLDERAKHFFKEAILSLATGAPPAPAPTGAPPALAGKIKTRKAHMYAFIRSLESTKISNDEIATDCFLDYSRVVDNDLMVVTEPAGIDTKDIHKNNNQSAWSAFHCFGVSYTGPRVAISRLRGLHFVKEAYGAEVDGVQFLVLILSKKDSVQLNQVLSTVSTVIPLKLQHVAVYSPLQPTSDPILAAIKLPSANKWMFHL